MIQQLEGRTGSARPSKAKRSVIEPRQQQQQTLELSNGERLKAEKLKTNNNILVNPLALKLKVEMPERKEIMSVEQ